MRILAMDLDGTLVNSGDQIYRSLSSASKDLLGVEIPSSLVSENLGLPITNILAKTNIPRGSYDKVISQFRDNLELEIIAGNNLFEGVIEFLIDAKKIGITLVIATSKPTYLANLVVENSELSKYIDFVQGTDGFPPKPDPEIIFRIQQKFLGKLVALVGDRTEDIHAAKRASILGIGVAQSAHSTETLVAAGADYVYECINDLLMSDIIHEIVKTHS